MSIYLKYAWAVGLCVLLGGSCLTPRRSYLVRAEGSTLCMDSTSTAATAMTDFIAPYASAMKAQTQKVIAYNQKQLTHARPESELGNLVADVLLAEAAKLHTVTPIDFAISNWGGIRRPYLAAGDLTVGNVYEILPFDNWLVVMSMEGSMVQQLLAHSVNLGGWPISQEVSLTVKDKTLLSVRIGGKPLDLTRRYIVALPDFVANGGDKCHFLAPLPRTDLGILLRDAFMQYAQAHPQLAPPSMGRIVLQQ